MKILAMEKESRGKPPDEFAQHLKSEAMRVCDSRRISANARKRWAAM